MAGATTRRHRGSAADMCRDRGWAVGTRLIGDEGYGPSVIEITAIGEAKMIAKCLGHNGIAHAPYEQMWVLHCRDWREATDDEIPVPLPIGSRVRVNHKDAEFIHATVAGEPDSQGWYRVTTDDGHAWFAPGKFMESIS